MRRAPLSSSSRPAFPVWAAVVLGIAVTLAQVIAAVALQDRNTVRAAYRTLYRWDSEHYLELAENGYRSSLPMPLPEEYTGRQRINGTNVAFFPAYPLLSRAAFSVAGGMRHSTAMTILAQFCAAGFWIAFLLLLRRWGAGIGIAIMCVLAVSAHPAAFYLVVPYSESLFLFSLLLVLLLAETRGVAGGIGVAAAGIVMTATRLFGLPFCAWPLLREWAAAEGGTPPARRRVARAVLIGAVASLGTIGFLAYCQHAFGAWNLYFLRQQWGWGIETDPFALLRHFLPTLFMRIADGDINGVSKALSSLTLWALLACTAGEAAAARFLSAPGWRMRAALLLVAWVSFALPFSALWHTGLQSMLRYVLLSHVLLVLWAARLAPCLGGRLRFGLGVGAAILCGIGFWWQIRLFLHFADGGWVA